VKSYPSTDKQLDRLAKEIERREAAGIDRRWRTLQSPEEREHSLRDLFTSRGLPASTVDTYTREAAQW